MHISINSASPLEAPHRAPWRTAEGATRTDPIQYTADAAFMALGNAVVVDDPPAFDASYQTLGWDGSAWTVTDRDLETLRAERDRENDAEQAAKLAPTDWVYVRLQDIGTAVPVDVKAERDAIRAAHDARETWIADQARTVAELGTMADAPGWPT